MSFKTNLSEWFNTKHNDKNFWQVPVRIERAADNPLDASTLFKSLADATKYANGEDPVTYGDGAYTAAKPYPGQFIAVVDETTGATTGYIIGGNGNLIELGSVESTLSGMNVVVGDQKVPLTIVDNKLELSVGGGLKMENGVLTVAEINTVSDISANATSNDPAATSAIVKYTSDYVAEEIEKLSADAVTATTVQTIKSISQENGKIKVEVQDIAFPEVNLDPYALSSDVENISANLDARIAANLTSIQDVASTVNTVSTDYLKATDFAALCTEIGLNEATSTNKVVTKKDIADLAGAMHFKGAVETLDEVTDPKAGDVVIITSTSKEYVYSNGTWVELGDELIYATKAEVSAVSVALSNDYVSKIGTVSVALSNDYVAKVEALSIALSTDLKTEIDARIAADDVLSNAIDNKVWTGNYADGLTQAESLSVVKISQADYHALVADPSGSKVDPNAVYIVNADGEYNMYGEKIVELSTSGVDGVAEAANVLYVQRAIAGIIEINGGNAG